MKNSIYLLIILLGLSVVTVAQPVPPYVPANGLLAWWSFNGDAYDLSGNGNDAINYGAVFVPDRQGNQNAAVSIDGFSTYLQVAFPSFSLSETGAFTYSIWVKKQIQSTSGVQIMIGTTDAGNFISNLQGMSEQQFGTNKQQQAWIWATCPHTLNVWDHYVGTYDAGLMKLYKNGAYMSTATYTYTGAATAIMPIWFGRGVSGNNYTGSLDDIGIWNRALTPSEIIALYQSCELTVTTDPVNQITGLNSTAKFIVTASSSNVNYQWQTTTSSVFQNVSNTGQFSGATNDTLTITNTTLANNNQKFRCIITYGLCSDTSSVAILTVNNNVGLSETESDNKILIYPNPSSSQITFIVPPGQLSSPFTLVDPLGRLMMKGIVETEQSTLDITSLKPGYYLLRIGENVKQFVKMQVE